MKNLLCLFLIPGTLEARAQPAAPAEARQFDFWVGNWEVFLQPSNQPAGHNRIEEMSAPGGHNIGTWRGWLPRVLVRLMPPTNSR